MLGGSDEQKADLGIILQMQPNCSGVLLSRLVSGNLIKFLRVTQCQKIVELGFEVYLVSGINFGVCLLNHYAYCSRQDIFHHSLPQITIFNYFHVFLILQCSGSARITFVTILISFTLQRLSLQQITAQLFFLLKSERSNTFHTVKGISHYNNEAVLEAQIILKTCLPRNTNISSDI